VAGARPEGRFGVLGFEGGDLPSLAVIGILKKGEVSLYIGNVDVFAVGWEEYAVGFPLTLVDRGDGFTGYAILVERVDVEPSVSVTDSKDMLIFLVQAEEASTVIEVNVLMLLVGTVLV